MKRFAIVALLAVALVAVVGGTALAAPMLQAGFPMRPGGMMGFGHMGSGMMGSGHMGPGMMGQGHMGSGHMDMGSMMHDDLETLLGISHEQIHEAHLAGKSLAEIAAERGVGEAQLIDALIQGREAALAEAVASGRITQQAADQMLNTMKGHITAMVRSQGMGPGMMHGSGNLSDHPCHGGAEGGQGAGGVRRPMRSMHQWQSEG
jgi:hypothetical protein